MTVVSVLLNSGSIKGFQPNSNTKYMNQETCPCFNHVPVHPKAFTCILVIGLLLIFASGCYYDSEEFLYPQPGTVCDTANVTYSQSVAPIIANYCLTCHSNSAAAAFGGNIRLESYDDVKIRADDHRLLGSIAHENGYSPMPQGAAKLDNCMISTVRIWVNSGAQNN